jgi:hypothetical protein
VLVVAQQLGGTGVDEDGHGNNDRTNDRTNGSDMKKAGDARGVVGLAGSAEALDGEDRFCPRRKLSCFAQQSTTVRPAAWLWLSL